MHRAEHYRLYHTAALTKTQTTTKKVFSPTCERALPKEYEGHLRALLEANYAVHRGFMISVPEDQQRPHDMALPKYTSKIAANFEPTLLVQ